MNKAREVSADIPFFQLNNLELLARSNSTSTVATEVSDWLAGTPEAGVHASAASIADSALMYAASGRAQADLMPVTVSMRLDYWKRPSNLGARLLGRAEVEEVDGDILFIRGRIEGPDGVVATATARSMLVPSKRGGSSAGSTPSSTERRSEAKNGSGGTAAGRLLLSAAATSSDPPSAEVAAAVDRITALEACRLAGVVPLRVAEGLVELSIQADARLERNGGVVHGGAVPVFGQLGCAAAVATVEPRVVPRRLDLTVEYLRPARVGEQMQIRAAVVHRSRSLLTTHAEMCNREGKPIARFYETASLTPG